MSTEIHFSKNANIKHTLEQVRYYRIEVVPDYHGGKGFQSLVLGSKPGEYKNPSVFTALKP